MSEPINLNLSDELIAVLADAQAICLVVELDVDAMDRNMIRDDRAETDL